MSPPCFCCFFLGLLGYLLIEDGDGGVGWVFAADGVALVSEVPDCGAQARFVVVSVACWYCFD